MELDSEPGLRARLTTTIGHTMRRKKDPQTQPADPAKFWPVPGVDGEPYPHLVQEALDLVEKETKRLKIRECKHEGRFPTTRFDDLHRRSHHVCACRDCGADRIACLPKQECDYSRRRTPNYGFPYERREERRTGTAWLKTEEQERREARTDRMVSRQIQRASTQLPVMVTLPSDPGTRPGALERAMIRATERALQESRRNEGSLARSTKTYILDAETREAALHRTEDRAPDLSWVRTMNGRQQLR